MILTMTHSVTAVIAINLNNVITSVTIHLASEQELTVVGPQKKKENEYHHDIDDETACTRELDNDDETTCIREPVGTGRNGVFSV